MEQRLLELEAKFTGKARQALGAGDMPNYRWYTGIAETLAETRKDLARGYELDEQHFKNLIEKIGADID